MIHKEFMPIETQIDLLCSRGLIIPDREVAHRFLLENNYYRVSGYTLTLRREDTFNRSVTFQNVMDIYNFDQNFRSILLSTLAVLETNFKSYFAYRFAKRYGPYAHYQPHLFSDRQVFHDTMQKVENLIEQNLKSNLPLQHYRQCPSDKLPFWVHIDVFTFGNASTFLSISHPQIQLDVGSDFGLITANRGELTIKSLKLFNILRNQCAHGNRLFNNKFQQKPKLSKQQRQKLRLDKHNQPDDCHLFPFLLLLKQFSTPAQFAIFYRSLCRLSYDYPYVALRYYGFPDNWKDILAE